MDKRKETPDILGALLGGESSETSPGPAGQEAVKPAEIQASKPARRQASKLRKVTESSKTEEPEEELAGKVKATYYLSLDTLDRLEDGWLKLRRMADREQRTSISKSLILDLALQIALDGLEQKGSGSELAGRILKP